VAGISDGVKKIDLTPKNPVTPKDPATIPSINVQIPVIKKDRPHDAKPVPLK
jgi:hypothetical protein